MTKVLVHMLLVWLGQALLMALCLTAGSMVLKEAVFNKKLLGLQVALNTLIGWGLMILLNTVFVLFHDGKMANYFIVGVGMGLVQWSWGFKR